MLTINYLQQSDLNECFEIHDHYYRDWTIGNFETFNTLDEAIEEAKIRLGVKEVRCVEIKRFFKRDGHVYFDGTKRWIVDRNH